MGLGSVRDFCLSEARARALEQRQKLADRIDPLAARQSERSAQAAKANALTFREAAAAWHETMSPRWSSAKHTEIVRNRLSKWVIPLIGACAVAEIETPDVLKVLQQPVKDAAFWVAHAVTASRVRNDVEQILSYIARPRRRIRPSGQGISPCCYRRRAPSLRRKGTRRCATRTFPR